MCPLGSEQIAGLGFEQVVRSAPVAIAVIDASGDVIHANARARELTARLGHEMPADLNGAIDIFRPDGRCYERHEWPVVRSITSGEEVLAEEFFYALPEGARLWICCGCSPVRDEDGEIVGAVLAMADVTERKRTAEQLAHQASLLDIVEDAVVGTDAEFRLTFWNRGAERLYGYTADEVLGRDARDIASYEGDASRLALEHELLEGDRTRTEITACRKDGTAVEVELIALAVRDGQGAITGYIGTHRDISERKRAERALREAQRRTETILESMSDEFFALDREWRYTYVNELALAQARRAAGRDITAGELLGMSVWELMPHHVGTAAEHELRRAMRERAVVEFEAYSEVTGRWMEVRVYPTEDGLAGYVHDISERKEAQAERSRRAEQQALVAQLGLQALRRDDLQSLMDEAVGLVARTLDVELAGVGELTPGSEAILLRAGFGWRDGLVGRRIGDLVASSSLTGYTLRAGEPVIVEDIVTDPRFNFSSMASDHGVVSALSVMIESPDEPFGVLATHSTSPRSFSASDVSFVQAVANVLAGAVERSRAQERLGEVREAERRRIARDLHDDALQELIDALVQADRGRSAGLGPEAAEQLVSTLKRVAQQLRAAIYDLRGKEEVSVPFPETLGALVDMHRSMAVECDIGLEVRWDPPVALVGDRVIEMLRIVGEALTNARRHSGARHVRVSARGSEDGICVEITDDGRGFDLDAASSGTDRMGIKGMRERAGLLGGDLHIRSEPGTGTTVRFEFGPPQDDEPGAPSARVLLVDDHAAVRQAIAGMFQQHADLDVVGQAGSLAEARGMLRDIDVAVIDLGLPDGYGGDLIGELRDVNPHAHALILSARLDPANVTRALSSGAADTLDKTADLDELVDTVRRLHRAATPPS